MTDPTADAEVLAAHQDVISLPTAAQELLERARSSQAGRAARTMTPGAGAPLKQTLLALRSGESLHDHDSPPAATLQVLVGSVRITGGGQEQPALGVGDLAPIPPVRHGLDALEDSAVLISVGMGGGR